MDANIDEARAWPGLDVFDRDGDHIGRLSAIYTEDDEPRFGLIRTGLFGIRSVLAPLAGAFEEGGALILDLGKKDIKGSPHLRRDEPLTPEVEDALYLHYGLESSTPADSGCRLELMDFEPAQRSRRAAR